MLASTAGHISAFVLMLSWCVLEVQGTCTTTVVADMASTKQGTGNSATSEADCETACQNDPRCQAYDFTTGSMSCELHTGKTAYKIGAEAGTNHGVMTGCDYWNYAGWEIGCGSTCIDETQGSNGVEISASNRYSCWYQCLQYPRCQGWDWNESAGTCNLLSDFGVATTTTGQTGWEHHTIICPTEPYASFLTGWRYYPAHRVNGGKLQAGEYSFIGCQELCDNDGDCQAVSWDVDHEACWLHYITGSKDTSCDNYPSWSKNTFHIKKVACTTANYPDAFLTVGA